MDFEFGNKQGGWDDNDEGGANNDGGARVGDEDNLEDMIRALTRDFTKQPERSRKFGKGDKSIEGDCVWC